MPWAELSDSRCYFELVGDGEPLILIPGLAATSRMWDAVTPELGQSFSLILLDNRGIGKSASKRNPTSIADFANDIVELLDFLQLDRAHVLGVSLGGVIAQRLAIDHPSRLDRLVLVSCADTFSPYLRQMSSFVAHTLQKFPRQTFVQMMELLGTAPEFLDANAELIADRIKAKCQTRISAKAVANQLRCLAAMEEESRQEWITAKTLVMAGEFDPIIPNCYARRMAERIPGAAFKLIAGAGHNPIVDHPEASLPTVIDFLRGGELNEKLKGTMNGDTSTTDGASPSMDVVRGGGRI